jgi:hypothetical protein
VWKNARDALDVAFDVPTGNEVVLSSDGVSLLRLLCLTHDLFYYRFDTDGTIQIEYDRWLRETGFNDSDIMQIHRLLAYANSACERLLREQTGGRLLDWHAKFTKPIGKVQPAEVVYIRQLLSEADKIDMLGPSAVDRCLLIVQERHPELVGRSAELHGKLIEMYRSEIADLPELFESDRGRQLSVSLRGAMAAKLNLSEPIKISKK